MRSVDSRYGKWIYSVINIVHVFHLMILVLDIMGCTIRLCLEGGGREKIRGEEWKIMRE